MKCWSRGLLATLLVLLTAGGYVHADTMTPWTYSWSRNPISVPSDNLGTGGISMTLAPLAPGTNMTGDSDIVVVNLSTFSSAPAGTMDTFTKSPYSLSLHLTDLNSNQSGDLLFNGVFDGKLSPTSSQITTTFLDPIAQKLVLGGHAYTVSLNSYVPPGLPDATVFGSIGAHIGISDVNSGGGSGGGGGGAGDPAGTGSGPQTVPEPTTLFLASLSLPAGLLWWRTRGPRGRNPGRPATADD
jgi:hypothetical protein